MLPRVKHRRDKLYYYDLASSVFRTIPTSPEEEEINAYTRKRLFQCIDIGLYKREIPEAPIPTFFEDPHPSIIEHLLTRDTTQFSTTLEEA